MTLRKDQVMQFRDMGYQHQGWAYECALLDRCTCLKEGPAAGKFILALINSADDAENRTGRFRR